MKKIIVASLVLILFAGFACKTNKPAGAPEPISLQVTKPSGIYLVGSFGKKPEISWDDLQAGKLLEFGDSTFNFQKNDTVLLNPQFGMEYFGDSIFRYEATAKSIILTNGEKRIEMPYTYDGLPNNDNGLYRLTINHKALVRLDLIHPQVRK